LTVWVQGDFTTVFPIALFSAPTIGAFCSRLFINRAPLCQNLHVVASMALCRGDKLDRAMAMPVVLPSHVLLHPCTSAVWQVDNRYAGITLMLHSLS
jgi:hypothetical protein